MTTKNKFILSTIWQMANVNAIVLMCLILYMESSIKRRKNNNTTTIGRVHSVFVFSWSFIFKLIGDFWGEYCCCLIIVVIDSVACKIHWIFFLLFYIFFLLIFDCSYRIYRKTTQLRCYFHFNACTLLNVLLAFLSFN